MFQYQLAIHEFFPSVLFCLLLSAMDFKICLEALRYYSLVFDAVYTPKITRLLREAQENGAKVVTGVEMFIGQAYEQYERFTGLPGKFKISSFIPQLCGHGITGTDYPFLVL
ncbi:hypothetical protein FXO37_31072 [Capsicum annuum]|nr:hypothetical protein FXO37_31072 [Capsicum annuum]